MKHRGARLLIWLLTPLLPLTAAVAAGEHAGWPFLQRPLEHFLSQRLGRAFVFGERFHLQLIGPVRMRSEALRVDGPRRDAPPLLRAGEVELALPWRTLLGLARGQRAGTLAVHSLSVDSLDLLLTRHADGQANWQFDLGERAEAADAAALSAPALPTIERLTLRQGRIRIDDALAQLQLDARLQSEEGGSLPPPAQRPRDSGAPAGAMRGLQASAEGHWRGLPLVAGLQAAGALPLVGGAASPPVPVRLNGEIGRARLSLDGTVQDLLHFGGLDGRFTLAGPSLAAVGKPLRVTLPTTAPFESRGRVRKQGALWLVDLAALAVGSSRLAGDFRFDTAPAVHRLGGRLTGSRLALLDLGPAFGTAGAGSTAIATPKLPPGRVLPRREFDIPSLRAMNADVQLDLVQVDLGTSRIAPLAPLRARVRLEDGVLALQDLQATNAGGQLRGELSVDARADPPQWRADLRWADVRLERFVRIANPRDRVDGSYVSGALDGRTRLQGQGRSTAALLASLDGDVRLEVREGHISHLGLELAGIDLAESLGLLLRGDEPLPMRCAAARLQVQDGRVAPRLAVLDTADTTLVIGGSLSLADERLALVVNASPHDFTPLALRGPLRVDGPLNAPQVRLDKGRITLRMAAAAALGALLSPVAAVLPLMDFGEPERPLCQDAVAQVRQRAS